MRKLITKKFIDLILRVLATSIAIVCIVNVTLMVYFGWLPLQIMGVLFLTIVASIALAVLATANYNRVDKWA